MTIKNRASRAYPASARGQKPSYPANQQGGFTLVELLVGMAIGLLVVAVAMGALMVSRNVAGTVSDASSIQQQAAYAMRNIGLQIRQAGSLFLNPNPTNVPGQDYLAPVAFETTAASPGGGANAFDPRTDTISSTGSNLNVGYRRYEVPVFNGAATASLSRNCVAGPADIKLDERIESIYQQTGTALLCAGNGDPAQPIVQNVANFQVRYLLQDIFTTPGSPQMRYVDAATVGSDWNRVQGVEVCLVLYGTETVDMPTGSSYTDCDGTSINMTTLTGARARRLHMVFRNVFQLRSQGIV